MSRSQLLKFLSRPPHIDKLPPLVPPVAPLNPKDLSLRFTKKDFLKVGLLTTAVAVPGVIAFALSRRRAKRRQTTQGRPRSSRKQ